MPDLCRMILPGRIDDVRRDEIAGLIRRFQAIKSRAWKTVDDALSGVSDQRPDRDELILDGERIEEAAEAVARWFDRHDVRHPVLCDGRYYAALDGELVVINPEYVIDVSEAPVGEKVSS